MPQHTVFDLTNVSNDDVCDENLNDLSSANHRELMLALYSVLQTCRSQDNESTVVQKSAMIQVDAIGETNERTNGGRLA